MKRAIVSAAASAVAAAAAATSGALAHDVLHRDHGHAHKENCGHQAVEHDGHVDYLHDGHLHRVHAGHVDEHVIAVSAVNPEDEALVTRVADAAHGDAHGPDDDHPIVQHGDHFDHVHNGRLHFAHGDHVDDHGPIKLM